MAPLARIKLLGQFAVRVGGADLRQLDSARAESLLACLLLHRDAPMPRQRVAFLLWPDSTEAQARTNLRHVLHTLRRGLPDADSYLEITSRTLRWRPEAPYWLDVQAYEQLLDPETDTDTPAADQPERRRKALREAVELYTGDLLESRYDEWLLAERERLRHRQLDALAELAALSEAAGAFAEAIAYTERLLRADPLREQAYRQLMRLHESRGDRARALRVYHQCSSTLERELGVEPAEETRAAYEALLPTSRTTRPASAPRAVGPPLVGRADERARLGTAWRSADAGHPQLVLVSGEPGVGKTRLVEELRAWCARRGTATADARCYPAEGSLAYGPVVAWLRSEAVWPRVLRLDRARLTELARLAPELLVELPDLGRPGPLPAGEQRHRLFDAVSASLLATGGPLLLVLDDLQHGDRETCQLLHYLLRVQPDARVLVAATARREEIDGDHPAHELLTDLLAGDRLVEIELAPLDTGETALLAERLIGAALAEAEAQRLHEETEGNPLFVVEAVRAGWTTGSALSPRVQAVLEARLAQLSPPARDLVEVAATIGRGFSADVLAATAAETPDVLVRGLDELWRKRIVREQGLDTYDFSHDKIREVAYLGVGPARRRQLHLRAARALEPTDTAAPGTAAAQIAAHYDRAGAGEQAVTWYRRAADAAQLLHADERAVELLDRALALLGSLPHTADRDAIELEVRTAELAPLVSLEAYSSPVMSSMQQRAVELAATLGIDPAPPLLRSLAMSALTRGNYEGATRFGEQLQEAAERRPGDDVLAVEAAYVLGIASFWQADFENARRYFELAVARYRPEDRGIHLMRYAQDPKVVCLGRLACTLFFLGEPEAAVQARAASLAWADEIEHPFSWSVALTFACLLALDMGDEPAVREYTAGLAGSTAGAVNDQVVAAFAGHVAVLDGDPDRGIAAIRAAVDHTQDGPAAPGQHAFMVRLLLAAYLAAGDAPAARETAERLLDMGGAARVWATEARRVCAERR